MITLGAINWACLVGVLGLPIALDGAKLPKECCDGRKDGPPGLSAFAVPCEDACRLV